MRIVSKRHHLLESLKQTYQTPFPAELKCDCGHRMLPVLSICDDEGLLANAKPENLKPGEFWFHDCVAIVTYLCLNVTCGKMTALWNQA